MRVAVAMVGWVLLCYLAANAATTPTRPIWAPGTPTSIPLAEQRLRELWRLRAEMEGKCRELVAGYDAAINELQQQMQEGEHP